MMKSVTRSLLPAFFSVLLAGTAGCAGSGATPKTANEASDHAEVGKPAPDLSIHTLNGKGTVSLDSLKGKTVIVDFWATWCGPCKQSFPKLEELQKKLGSEVVIVGISVDDENDGIVSFAKENGATFPIGWDEGHSIAGRWKVSTMPTTFIVDPTGTVRYIHAGYHDGETDEMAKEVSEISGDPSMKVAKSEKKKDKADDAVAANTEVAAPEPPRAPEPAAAEEEEEKAPPPPPKKTKKTLKKTHGKSKKSAKKKA